MNKIIDIISIISLQGGWIFFMLLSYFGIRYEGVGESNLFIYFWGIISSFAIIMLSKKILHRRLSKAFLYAILTIFIMTFMFVISGMRSHRFFYAFIAMSAPSTIFGVYFAENRLVYKFPKYFFWLILYSLYPLAISYLSDFGDRSRFNVISGWSTLGLGYGSASLFIFLYYYFQNKAYFEHVGISPVKKGVLKIFKNNIVIVFSMLFVLFTAIAVGSRGPLVSIIGSILFIELFKDGLNIKLLRAIIATAILSIGLVYVIRNMQVDAFRGAFSRINMLIEGIIGGDVASASSGRDSLYKIAWNHFTDHPFLGLGFAGFIKKYNGYPHNIVLEFLADYGILGSSIWFSLFIYIFKPLFHNLKRNPEMLLFVAVFMIEVFGLMFSNTFLNSYILWFYFGYGLYMRFGENNKKKATGLVPHL